MVVCVRLKNSICLNVCGGTRFQSAAPSELSKLFNLSLPKYDNEDACAQAENGEHTKVTMYHGHNQMRPMVEQMANKYALKIKSGCAFQTKSKNFDLGQFV